MKKQYVEMGKLYFSKENGLVKVICRAYDKASNDPFIIYTEVEQGGCAGRVLAVPELTFKELFLY